MGEAFIVRKGGGGKFGSDIESGLIVMYYGLDTEIPFGWDLCDGTKGNPDLRNYFIVGAGDTYTVESTGGFLNSVLLEHTHTGTLSSVADHTHTQPLSTGFGSSGSGRFSFGAGGTASTISIGSSGSHTHTVTISTEGVSSSNTNLPPYYGLYYIIKLEETL
jgi:hypothetical protein